MTSEFTIAVHALVYLNHMQTTVASEKLAQNVCTNPARIRKVMVKLKKKDLILTKEGKEGGYLFHLDPAQITLNMVFEALNTKLLSPSWMSGDHDMKCLIASGMAGIMENLYDTMEVQCKNYLNTVTIKDIDSQIFRS